MVGRIAALWGVSAMLVALFTAPLFHSHDEEDTDPHHGSFVHAHLLEAEKSDHHSSDEIEDPHGHRQARWIDVFTFRGPSPVFELAVVMIEEIAVPVTIERREIAIHTIPCAHGPPDPLLSVPRPPPSI